MKVDFLAYITYGCWYHHTFVPDDSHFIFLSAVRNKPRGDLGSDSPEAGVISSYRVQRSRNVLKTVPKSYALVYILVLATSWRMRRCSQYVKGENGIKILTSEQF